MKGKQKLKKNKVEVKDVESIDDISFEVILDNSDGKTRQELIESMSYQELYDMAKSLGLEYSKRPKKSVLKEDINKNK